VRILLIILCLSAACLPAEFGERPACELNTDCPGFYQVCVSSQCFKAGEDWSGDSPTSQCGDGVLQDGEVCDDGDENSDLLPSRCRPDCTEPRCGDGVVDPGEDCDDGNDESEDTCASCKSVRRLALGARHVCTIKNSELWCWGYGIPGLNHLSPRENNLPLRIQANLESVQQVQISEHTTCVVSEERPGLQRVLCAGANDEGGLSREGAATDYFVVVDRTARPVLDFRSTDRESFCFATDTAARCWGSYSACSLGPEAQGSVRISTILNSGRALEDGSMEFFRSLSLGSYQVCAVTNYGGVTCRGIDISEQVVTPQGNAWRPVCSPYTFDVEYEVEQIVLGLGHRCLRLGSGQVACIGSNSTGALGIGEGEDKAFIGVPQILDQLEGIAELSTNDRTTCARDNRGRVWCWGDNKFGKTGSGHLDPVTWTPTQVIGLPPVKQIEVKLHNVCAVAMDNNVWCWGNNRYGQVAADERFFETSTPYQSTFFSGDE
jgi:cysteine-rich repeat protein